jgi:hypothetical protein
VHDGDVCYDNSGLQCPGTFVVDCRGNYQRQYCECAPDGFYRCSVPGCEDGGTDDALPFPDVIVPPHDAGPAEAGSVCPAAPMAGAACHVPGYGCWYGGDADSCRTYCNCDSSGAWLCVALPCDDAAATD